MGRLRALGDWFDSRTSVRAGVKLLLDEPLPSGVGWWFVTGSVLLFLLAVQLLTGIVLAVYYVPSPDYAYDSILFITERVTFGRLIRGLHFFGASFIVIAAVVHMMRVVLFASYKKPREVNWIVGVVLLLVILAFALTGYLLPWDQKAYWATTVTINIARSAPFGDAVATFLKGGAELGALTLLRWYAAHVFLLPACLIGFTVAHLYLMRRQGISGPIAPVPGPPKPFYPYHALKDTLAIAAVFALLVALAASFRVPLDAVADPTDASYVPRPEWYFMSLFELLKHFPGPFEPLATIVLPGVLLALLFLLPFLDRGPARRPADRPLVTGGFALVGAAIVVLSYLGYQGTPANADPSQWGLLPLAGRLVAQDPTCAVCHRAGGPASPMENTRLRKEPEWLLSHVRDPEVIAPGIRTPPRGGMNDAQAWAVLGYMKKVRAGTPAPAVSAEVQTAADVFGRSCGLCHAIDGDGAADGPDLSRAGAMRDAAWLRAWIADPSAVDPAASMPAFADLITAEEMTAVVDYLAARK